jgi:tetratricopeptide (TPR) repeat protein
VPTELNLRRQISRLKQAPQRDDTWEGAIVSLPLWVDGEPGADPYRPRAAICVSTRVQLGHFSMPEDQSAVDETTLATVLVEMARSAKLAGYRPRRLRVRDEQLAAALARPLEGLDTIVELASELPDLDDFLDAMAADLGGDIPPALDAPGVTPDRLRAFAGAAKQFYDAAPWRHLDDGDLIRAEKPSAAEGLRLFSVMGAAGQEFGLGFFSSEERYDAMMAGTPPDVLFSRGPEWAVFFSPAWETPAGDVLAWERHALPLASGSAYPMAMRGIPGRKLQRPDAGQLAYFEGLLRALAATTEDEMDAGRWSHIVDTAESRTEFVITLPDLLEPRRPPSDVGPFGRLTMERLSTQVSRLLGNAEFESSDALNAALEEQLAGRSIDEMPSGATTPLEQAQDLIFEAYEARGRRQLQLIRRALALSPDCADAYTLLAERAPLPVERRAFYEQAVAAGERALGPEAFGDPERSLWGDVTTRPYMRARAALAECLRDEGDLAAAIGHHRALLTLNPGDNQGIRYRLLVTLLEANLSDDAAVLVDEHGDEPTAVWQYASVLLAFRAGDRRLARTRLQAAIRSNRHLAKYLAGQRELPDDLPAAYTIGGPDEGAIFASHLIDAWSLTPGAVDWLHAELRSRRR